MLETPRKVVDAPYGPSADSKHDRLPRALYTVERPRIEMRRGGLPSYFLNCDGGGGGGFDACFDTSCSCCCEMRWETNNGKCCQCSFVLMVNRARTIIKFGRAKRPVLLARIRLCVSWTSCGPFDRQRRRQEPICLTSCVARLALKPFFHFPARRQQSTVRPTESHRHVTNFFNQLFGDNS